MPTFDNGEDGLSVRNKINAAITKVDGIEEGATGDQTGAEIKALYEAEPDTNAFTDADHSKLDGIESGATADQTAAEIKTLYESNSDTNEFSDAEKTKLAGVETGATADQSAAEIKTAYESNSDTNAFTDADHSKLDGVTAGADVTQAEISGASSKTTPVDADSIAIVDSAASNALKRLTFANLKTYLNGAYVALSTLTTKGDILVRTVSGVTRVGVGTNGQVLKADSAETAGVKWADESGGGGLSDVVDDTSPQLGGNLDAQNNNITSVGDFGDGTTDVDATYLVHGSAKAWASIAADGASMGDSFNISSLDDDGTGDRGLNFTNNMANSNYAAAALINFAHNGSSHGIRTASVAATNTTSVEIDCGKVNSVGQFLFSDEPASAAVWGDLA